MSKLEKDEFIQKHFSKECVVVLHDLAQQPNRKKDSGKTSIRSTCISCSVVFDNIEDFKRHAHKPFTCKYLCLVCNNNFNTRGGFLVHILQHLMDVQNKFYSIMHVCNVCCDGFSSEANLEEHKNLHHTQIDNSCNLSLVKEEPDTSSHLESEIKVEEPVLLEPQEPFEPPTISLPELVPIGNNPLPVNETGFSPTTLPLVPWLAPILPQTPPFLIYGSQLFIRVQTDPELTNPSGQGLAQTKEQAQTNEQPQIKEQSQTNKDASKKGKKAPKQNKPKKPRKAPPKELPTLPDESLTETGQPIPLKYKLVPNSSKNSKEHDYKLVRVYNRKVPISPQKNNFKEYTFLKENEPLQKSKPTNPDPDVEEVPSTTQSQPIVIESSDSDTDEPQVKNEESVASNKTKKIFRCNTCMVEFDNVSSIQKHCREVHFLHR